MTTKTVTWSGGFGGVKDQSIWIRFQPRNRYFNWLKLSFNPVVTLLSLAIILAFSLWAIILPDEASTEFAQWKDWVGFNFTWLYIGSQVNYCFNKDCDSDNCHFML